MTRRRLISVTEAARSFADMVSRAFYRNETTVLLKNGVPVAELGPPKPVGTPADAVLRAWKERPRLSPDDAADFASDVEAFRAPGAPLRSAWD